MPEDRFLASWAERPARPVNGKIDRQTINTDVEEGANCSAQDKSEAAQEKLGSLHHQSPPTGRLLEA